MNLLDDGPLFTEQELEAMGPLAKRPVNVMFWIGVSCLVTGVVLWVVG